MANAFTAIIPQIMARGLSVLRENAVTPRLVNLNYEAEARQRGDTIDIPVPSSRTTYSIVPGLTMTTNQDSSESKIQLTLDEWKGAKFHLTDKEQQEIESGFVPRKIDESVKALVNTVDSFVLGLYKGIYNHGGTAGTTPFQGATHQSALVAFRQARTRMNKTLAPQDTESWRVVLDPDAEGFAQLVGPFLKADERGDQGGILRGEIGTKLGMPWYMNQNIPTHTAGTLSHTTSVLSNGAATAGTNTIVFNRATLTGTMAVGDLFTLNGVDGQFVVRTLVTAASNSITVVFDPALPVTVANDTTAVPITTNSVSNLMFHRDAIALAVRPQTTQPMQSELGSIIATQVDTISMLPLTLEISRQYNQTTWEFKILYGAKLVRPEFGARILG